MSNGGGATPRWITIGIQVLGAVAGVGALITFLGGAMLWLRFEELHLAADQSVTLAPSRLLVAIGANALAGPLAAGVAALIVVGFAAELWYPRKGFWVVVGLVGAAALVNVGVIMWGLEWQYWFPMIAAVTLAGLAVVTVVRRAPAAKRAVHVGWTVFAAFAICGAVLSISRTLGAPKMEPVAVLLKPGTDVPQGGDLVGETPGISGFWVGKTDDHVYVAPLPGSGDPGDPFADAEIDRIVEIPRSEVLRLATSEPLGLDNDESGRTKAQLLLEDLRARERGKDPAREEIVTTSDPVVAFAPLVHIHADEELFPMSAARYVKYSTLAWAHGCEEHVVVKRFAAGRTFGLSLPSAQLGLGNGTYRHRSSGANCGDDEGDEFDTAKHTRPFDRRGQGDPPAKEGFYLDVANDKQDGGGREDKVRKEGPQEMLKSVPAYYQRRPEKLKDEAGKPLLDKDGKQVMGERITYWLFYGLSQPPGPKVILDHFRHEGDWERVSVLTKPGPEDGQVIPLSVRYHFHDENRDVPWPAVRRVGSAGPAQPTHPVVYSANGSHASYPRAGRHQNAFVVGGRRRATVYDEGTSCGECPQWRTWELLWDVTAQPWYGFGGAWGDVGGIGGTTGPLGPSSFKIGGRVERAPEQTVGTGPPAATAPQEVQEKAEED